MIRLLFGLTLNNIINPYGAYNLHYFNSLANVFNNQILSIDFATNFLSNINQPMKILCQIIFQPINVANRLTNQLTLCLQTFQSICVVSVDF